MKSTRLVSMNTLIAVVALGMAAYHLASTQYLFFTPPLHLNMHLMFTLVLVLSAKLTKSSKKRLIWGLGLIALSLVATLYVQTQYITLEKRALVNNATDIVIGVILLVVILEAARQAYGLVLPIIAMVFILYAYFGHFISGALRTPEFQFSEVISRLTIGASNSGLYGGPILAVSAKYIFLFVLFGGLMRATGAIDFFMEIGKLAGRVLAGGPGMTAVVASALVGTVTGSAMANVGVTGSFTIPMMKRIGYRPEQAGAIEAAASNGGQIMPPVLGSAAFVMAEVIGVPYVSIMLAAVIPALLYFATVGLYVQFQAKQSGIKPSFERVDTRKILLGAPVFILGLLMMTVLLIAQYSPMYAAFWAIVAVVLSSVILSFFSPRESRTSLGGWVNAFVEGTKGGAQIAISCAVITPVVAVLNFTGLGVKLASVVETLASGNLVLALLLTMVVAVVLGMGAPTLVAYLIPALVIGPVLVKMGVPRLSVHFFIFLVGVFAAVTPPVALAALVAAGIAGASYLRTALEATKASLAAFLLPYLVVSAPVLLLRPADPLTAVVDMAASVLGLFALAAVASNFYLVKLTLVERAVLFAIGLASLAVVFTHTLIYAFVGAVLFVLVTAWQWRRGKLGAQPRVAAG